MFENGIFEFDVVEIALEVEGSIGLPQLEDHVDGFNRHQPLGRRIWQVKKPSVSGHAPLSKTSVNAAL